MAREVAALRQDAHPANVRQAEFDEIEDARDAALAPVVRQLLEGLGEDVERPGLERTPQRVARSLRFLTEGHQVHDVREVINGALFATDASDMVVVQSIEFYSLCEHHLLPFFGRVHIGYVPDGTLLGLSKFARVVDVFARRMQVQERMTAQIADALVEVLAPQGVGVVSDASHLCMMMRGVEKQGSSTRTSAMRGVFRTDARTRGEFLDAIRHATV